jgi:hypothetical protein
MDDIANALREHSKYITDDDGSDLREYADRIEHALTESATLKEALHRLSEYAGKARDIMEMYEA